MISCAVWIKPAEMDLPTAGAVGTQLVNSDYPPHRAQQFRLSRQPGAKQAKLCFDNFRVSVGLLRLDRVAAEQF